MKHLLFILTALVWIAGAGAQNELETKWNDILSQYVQRGEIEHVDVNVVDYEGIMNDPRFSELIDLVQNSQPESLTTKNEKLAFWINVYNIATVKMITDNYPVESIRKIGSLLSPVWKKRAVTIAGTAYSLNEIEHEILRKMQEPRIHFAIVCASVSCPDLRTEAYTADKLEQQLDDQLVTFLSNPKKGALVDTSKKTVYLSSIFKWFKEDFGNLSEFVAAPLQVELTGFEIKFMDYNWNLNGRGSKK